jgi:hypothetical protein
MLILRPNQLDSNGFLERLANSEDNLQLKLNQEKV